MAKEPLSRQKKQEDPQASPASMVEEVRALARILKQYGLTSLEMEQDGRRIRLGRECNASPLPVASFHPQPSPEPAPARAPSTAPVVDDGSVEVTSPFVGTFYRAPSPEAPPFVIEGQAVHKGQVLCIVEAMKLMNEIECELDCTIVKILIQNGEPVEFGQPLFRVRPSS